ncbi:hypothetical protein NLI96_g8649 [Meripilus lineatus]|uniref:BTB domain-containing protein n=1 Tax=Meripilus lineatus TaxID=2056292 RepID=A0AAD5UYJ6_9APHY|nr:hypothetical protein NLI96_g8649 [Physisporinus lineatus]
MFSLLPPASTNPLQASQTSSIVPPAAAIFLLAEDGATLDHMLRRVYHVGPASLGSLDKVTEVLEASLKYQLVEVFEETKLALQNFAQKDPRPAYAIAIRFNLEDQARIAAKIWKEQYTSLHKPAERGKGSRSDMPMEIAQPSASRSCTCGRDHGRDVICGLHEYYGGVTWSSMVADFESTVGGASFVKEMATITAGPFFRLIRYISTRGPSEQPSFCGSRVGQDGGQVEKESIDRTEIPTFLHPSDANIVLQSKDGASFFTHTLLLRAASAEQILQVDSHSDKNGMTTLHLEESQTTLSTLLQLCYPFPPPIDNLDNLQLVLLRKAAEKYQIPGVLNLTQKMIDNARQKYPLAFYLLIKQYGREQEAGEMLKKCTSSPSAHNKYAPEMESCSAEAYYEFLKAHYEVQQKAVRGMPGLGKKKRKRQK